MRTNTKTTERIVFVEYQNGRPFAVVTIETAGDCECRNYYDVEWCERDKAYYYDMSGSGGSGLVELSRNTTFWAAPDFRVKRRAGCKRLARLKCAKELRATFEKRDYSPDSWNESDCQYCSVCKDWLPSDDADELCDHVWWCDDAGWWSTPDERCPVGCSDCMERGHETRAIGHPLALIAEGWAQLYGDNIENNCGWYNGDRIALGYGQAAEDAAWTARREAATR